MNIKLSKVTKNADVIALDGKTYFHLKRLSNHIPHQQRKQLIK